MTMVHGGGKELISNVLREVPSAIGGVAGGVAGTALAPGAGTAAAGAGGALAADAISEFIRDKAGIKTERERIEEFNAAQEGREPVAPDAREEVLRKLMIAGGGAFEALPLAAASRYPLAAASKGMRITGTPLKAEYRDPIGLLKAAPEPTADIALGGPSYAYPGASQVSQAEKIFSGPSVRTPVPSKALPEATEAVVKAQQELGPAASTVPRRVFDPTPVEVRAADELGAQSRVIPQTSLTGERATSELPFAYSADMPRAASTPVTERGVWQKRIAEPVIQQQNRLRPMLGQRLATAKRDIAEFEKAIKADATLQKKTPGMSTARNREILSDHIKQRKETVKELTDMIKSFDEQADAAAKLSQAAEEAAETTAPKRVPSDFTTAINRMLRPAKDFIDRHAPEIGVVTSRAEHGYQSFTSLHRNTGKEILKEFRKSVPFKQRPAAKQAIIHILNNTDPEEIPEVVAEQMLNPSVRKVATRLRKEYFDEIWSYSQEPEITELFGKTGYIEDYFPWMKDPDPKAAMFRSSLTDEAGRVRYVRDPGPEAAKAGFMKRRTGGLGLTNTDLEAVMKRYNEGMANTYFRIKAMADGKELAAAYGDKSGFRRLLDNYLDFFGGQPSTRQAHDYLIGKLIDKANELMYLRLLGFPNVTTPIKNLGQIGNVIIEEGPVRTLQGMTSFRKGARAMQERGLLETLPGFEHTGERLQGFVGKQAERLMVPFSASEQFLRGASYSAGLKGAAKAGLSTRQADTGLAKFFLSEAGERAQRTVARTQFEYSNVNPIIMSHSPLAKLVKPFTSYPIRQASFLYDKTFGDIAAAIRTGEGLTQALVQAARAVSVTAAGAKLGFDMLNLVAGKAPGVNFLIKLTDFGARALEDLGGMYQTGAIDHKKLTRMKKDLKLVFKTFLETYIPLSGAKRQIDNYRKWLNENF
jgi:hypothetical protein